MYMENLDLNSHQKNPVVSLQRKLLLLFEKTQAIDFWQETNWAHLSHWFGDFDIADIITYGK